MKTLREISLEGKKIILRSEFNEPIENGVLLEDERIKAATKSIRFILENQPQALLLVAHLGRPEGKRELAFSLKPVAKELEKLLGVQVALVDTIENLVAVMATADFSAQGGKKVYLLENLRFWPEEEAGDDEFARKIAENFDVYVNDCFSASHRDHSSLTRMPKYTKEKCAGLLLEEEYQQLSQARNNPDHPAVAIIGGAKIETKLPVINNLLEIYDQVLVGGMIANEALDQKLELGEKIVLPVDFSPAGLEPQRLDIGPRTVESFREKIGKAKTIVWNGPLGKFEDKECDQGTRLIMEAVVANQEAKVIIGGGETLEALEKVGGKFSDFDYVSMSGGAMLEFMAGKNLPGIQALE